MDDLTRLRAEAGWIRHRAHAVAHVRGEKALAFVHATTSQDLERLRPGEGALTCVLDPGGRVLSEVRALALADGGVLLDGDPNALPALVEDLARVAPLSGCEVVGEDWECLSVRGPRAGEAIGGRLPQAEHAWIQAGGALSVRVDWGVPGFDLLVPAGASAPAIDAAEVGADAYRAARIASGRTRYGVDVTAGMIVNETPLIARAVSFSKGCYPGQESVARVRNLGRIRRAVVGLEVDGPPPAPGAPVVVDGEEAGHVTSAAALDGGAAAFAYARAEILEAQGVTVEGAPARALSLF